MTQLLIDMGNSCLKWRLAAKDCWLTPCQRLPNTRLNADVLIAAWRDVPQPLRVVVACVSDNALLAQVQSAVYRLWHCEIQRVQAQAQMLGVTNAYAQPERLGVDRWLALIAARHDYPLPVCVVDCGTAITIDVLNADGVHQGGLIARGCI